MMLKIRILILVWILPAVALAQDVNPGEVLERPKIYSPYV